MAKSLPHLHDPNYGGINLVLPILKHSLLCSLLLIIGFFELDLKNKSSTNLFMHLHYAIMHSHLIDLNLEKSISEIFVENEFVAVIDVFPLWNFSQNSGFPTGK